jgi:hypothetical protein
LPWCKKQLARLAQATATVATPSFSSISPSLAALVLEVGFCCCEVGNLLLFAGSPQHCLNNSPPAEPPQFQFFVADPCSQDDTTSVSAATPQVERERRKRLT